MKAAQPGQYRLVYRVTDAKSHTIEGAYLFVVRGDGFDGKDYRFNDLELVTDKREYTSRRQGQAAHQHQQEGQRRAAVRPARPTASIRRRRFAGCKGKSIEEEIAVVQRDMPNFFIEAVTIADGRVHSEVREVIVPPEKRMLNVEVVHVADRSTSRAQKANVKIKLTDFEGKPFIGSTVVSMYDKSVEYISGGSNVPEIKEFFWKWRRSHYPRTETSLDHYFGNLLRHTEIGMSQPGPIRRKCRA